MLKKSRIWHFSDPHTFHEMMQVPDADIAICSGDVSNPRDRYENKRQVLKFLDWYGQQLFGYKIFVAGNHDTSIESGLVREEDFLERDIIYLQDEEVTINGLKIYGSPWTPSFGIGWSFNCRRDKIHKHWDKIPEDTDIVVTHGPPKGILDLSYSTEGLLEFCGDLSLKKRMKLIQPKLVCFGHIHNCDNITNQGTTKLSDHDTIYSNGSIVTDGRFGKINNNGNLFDI